MSHVRNGWFERIPRRFFAFAEWHFAVYVGFGYLLVGVLHYRIWLRSGSVETLLSNLEFSFPRPSARTALLLFALCGAVVCWLALRLLRRLRRMTPSIELVFWGTTLSMVAAWVPWLFASSVVNTMFLFLFGMAAIIGFGLTQRMIARDAQPTAADAVDPWKAFVHALKASVAVLALLAGALATAVLLPWRQTEVEGPELFRYSVLSAYLVVGLIGFVLMPLLTRALEVGPSESVDLEPPSVL